MTKDLGQLELRAIREDEFRAFGRSVELHFANESAPERLDRWRGVLDPDRCFAVLDGARIVGNCAIETFDVSLPGADPQPCGGVTAVGVAADWRRRGLLRWMMRTMLDQCHERGEPFAALYASESPIYGRFGFGIAAPHVDHTVDTVRARIADPVGTDDVELVDAATALEAFPAIYEAARDTRAGMMSRSDGLWRLALEHDDPDRREGFSPRHHALVPGRGFAVYRWKDSFDHYTPNGDVNVAMLVATDPEAESALWELVFDVDLTVRLTARMRPVDDPLLHLVDNRALVRDTGAEHLYLRLVDLPAALASRGYDADGAVTFAVTDEMCPWNTGTWRLEVRDGAAVCQRTTAEADVQLDTRDLAALVLGGVRLGQLVWARRATVGTPSTVDTVDRMFAARRAPWNPFEF